MATKSNQKINAEILGLYCLHLDTNGYNKGVGQRETKAALPGTTKGTRSMKPTRVWLQNDDGNLEAQFQLNQDGTKVTVTMRDFSSGHELGRRLDQRTVSIEEARQECRRLTNAGFKLW
jgi:hypothetical protein